CHLQRRLYAALEANRLGRGGVGRVVKLAGTGAPAVARGRRGLAHLLQGQALKQGGKSGGGRPRTAEGNPDITAPSGGVRGAEGAGRREGEQKWVGSSARKLAKRLNERGFSVGQSTVWRLLKRMEFSMRTNVRRRRGITRDPSLRDEQFRYIASQRKAFAEA